MGTLREKWVILNFFKKGNKNWIFFGKCAPYLGGDFTVYPKYDARNFLRFFTNKLILFEQYLITWR